MKGPMIHTYTSHSLDKLAQRFSDIFQSESFAPLDPVWVVVQNNEIKEWLSLQLASKQGIAGNFRFIFPSEFMWTLYRLKETDTPQSLPSDLNAMQWALFDLFRKEPKLLDLIPVYDTDDDSTQKRFQLSSQVADIFDQYQVYRPDMLQAWLDRKLVSKNKHEKWQSALWKRLNMSWNENENSKSIQSRSGAYSDLINWFVGRDEVLINKLPDRLFVFGLSHLNQPFLEIVSQFSMFKEVHFLHRNSSHKFENEDLQKLLSDWGRTSEEEFGLLQELLKNNSSEPINYDLDEEPLFGLSDISVHSCHNTRREVEVLKDSMLDYFDKHPNSGPEDVLVLVPDAETYMSEFETIFSGSEEDPALPISQLFRTQQSAEHALTVLLDAIDSSYKPSTLLELINLEPIKQTFSFSDDELERLEEWIIENKIHRGIGKFFNSPFSWQKGLNQLLMGFIMEPGELDLYEELVPYRSVSSNEDMMLAARFSSFIHAFIEAVKGSQLEHKPIDWLEFVGSLIQAFLDGDEESGSSRLKRSLGKLKEQLQYSDVSEKVTFQMMKSWIKTQFSSNDSSSGRFGQGITVSSYIPYRSVPFKFIAVLGLNEGVFPRKAVRPEFDLIYASPKPGDRIQKEDDTYLFLETVLAAGDHLHLSYQGQDQRSDAKRLPSMPVQQLLDVMSKDRVPLFEHKLHPFSTDYFLKKNGLRSYSSVNLKVARNLQNKADKTPVFVDQDFYQSNEEDKQTVFIKDLISFFTNTSKYISQNYLGVSDSIYLNDIIDRESFDLNKLKSYYLDDFIHSSLSKGNSKERMFDYARASGMVPDKLKGEKVFQSEFDQILELHQQLTSMTTEEEQVIDVEMNIEGIDVVGKVTGIFGDMLVTSRIGKRKPKYEIGHWLKHLLVLESGFPIQKSVFVSKEGNDIEVFELRSGDIPNGVLQDYMNWFLSERSILSKAAFFPATSKSYAEKWNEEKDKSKSLYEARKTWEPSYKNTFVESNDYYNQALWRNQDPLIREDFHENALRFWEPFLSACGEEG